MEVCNLIGISGHALNPGRCPLLLDGQHRNSGKLVAGNIEGDDMNRIFRIIFSKVKGMFVVGSEHIKAHGHAKKFKPTAAAAALMLCASLGSVAMADSGGDWCS